MTRDTAGFDFFAAGELPAPSLPAAEVAAIAAAEWGLDVVLEPLGSQQDQNFLARARGDPHTVLGVVKITNPAFTASELAAQDAAAARIAAAWPELRVATTTVGADGLPRSVIAETSEGALAMRLLQYLPGGTLTGERVPLARGRRAHGRPRRPREPRPRRLHAPRPRSSAAVGPAPRRPRGRAARAPPPRTGEATAGDGCRDIRLGDDRVARPRASAAGRAPRSHRRQRRLPHRSRHPHTRRNDRLRRRHRQLGGERTRDHDLVGAPPRRRRAGVGAPGDPGVPRAATALRGRGRGDLASRRAARGGARRERRAPGAARRRRERLRGGRCRTGVAHLRAGGLGAERGDDGRLRRGARHARRCRSRRRAPRRTLPRVARARIRTRPRRAPRHLDHRRRRRRRRVARPRPRAAPGARRTRRRGIRGLARTRDAAAHRHPHAVGDIVGHGAGRHRHLVLGGSGARLARRTATRRRGCDRRHRAGPHSRAAAARAPRCRGGAAPRAPGVRGGVARGDRGSGAVARTARGARTTPTPRRATTRPTTRPP